MREVLPPSYGTLEIKQGEDFGFWPEKRPRSQCNKTRVKGVVVRYTPKPGYAGVDTLTYESFASTTGMRRYSLTVNVL